jgi:apolipoprotein N-acyltransferase
MPDPQSWPQSLRLLAAGVVGALLALAFAPYGIWPLAVLCPAVLMALWQGATPRHATWLGFVFGFGTFAVGTWWLYISIHIFGEAPIWLTLLLTLALVVIMAAYYALLGFLVARCLPARGGWRWLAGMPALWLLMEWLRGRLFTGFPWLSLGYSQTDSWLAGLAPVLGVYGLSAVLLVGSGALLAAWNGGARLRGLALALLVLPWIAGLWLGRVDWTHVSGAPVSVAIVQGAIPQDIKWLLANRQPTRDIYRELNEQALGARLILWPESAVTELANQITRYLADIYRRSSSSGSDVVLGVLRVADNGEDVYNSMLALTQPLAFYDKRHLVPYSEYFPVPEWVRGWLQRLNLPYSDISKGAENQPVLHAGGLSIAATICFEDAFGSAQRSVLGEAEVLANVTNDAWFGHSSARFQHFQISRMRAIEAQRYLLRAANDGVSAVVGPRGEVVQRAPEYQQAVIRGTVTPRRGLTPYAMTGDWPILALSALALILAALKGGLLASIKHRRFR